MLPACPDLQQRPGHDAGKDYNTIVNGEEKPEPTSSVVDSSCWVIRSDCPREVFRNGKVTVKQLVDV